jgi:transmembrane sensor
MTENIWNLMAKKLSGEATTSELTELEKLLRANPDLHYSVQPLIDLWQARTDPDESAGPEAFERHLQRMEELGIDFASATGYETGQPAAAKRRTRRYLLTAGVLILLVALTTIATLGRFSPKSTSQPSLIAKTKAPAAILSEISTRNGSRTTLILPDGTKVWLNAGSKLTYDSAFGKSQRDVSLTGEGYFDVVRNKQIPFIIHASKINVKVLGTEFDVKSYPSDKTTEASLIRGSIEVTFNDQPSKKVILKPNEKLVIDNFKFQNHLAPTTDNAPEKRSSPEIPRDIAVKNLTYENKTGAVIETSWVDNKLVFQAESFDDIALKLERWYGVSIKFDNDRLKDTHLTGSFDKENIRQALDALKLTADFNYSIDGNNNINIY